MDAYLVTQLLRNPHHEFTVFGFRNGRLSIAIHTNHDDARRAVEQGEEFGPGIVRVDTLDQDMFRMPRCMTTVPQTMEEVRSDLMSMSQQHGDVF